MPVPRRRSAPAADDYIDKDDVTGEPEDKPAGRRRRNTEAEKPAGRSRRSKVAEDKPARSSRRSKSADDDDNFKDEDENEKPKRSSRVQSGWAAAKRVIEEAGDFAPNYTFPKDDSKRPIWFLDDAPFASWRQHFVNEIQTGKKSFVCPGKGSCPLCDEFSYKVDSRVAFNVAPLDIEDTDELRVEVLYAGPMLLGIIEAALKDDPELNDHAWFLRRTGKVGSGKGGKIAYSLAPIKNRDLEEDTGWELDPLLEELGELEGYDADIIEDTSKSKLDEVADILYDSGH